MTDGVTIISVAFNSSAAVADLLASVPADVSVIIVDNASNDVAKLAALAAAKNVRLHRLSENVGFGAACNVGASLATTPYLFFLNPDATLMETTLDQLVAADRRIAGRNAFNPRILDAAGRQFLRAPARIIRAKKNGSKTIHPNGDASIEVLSGSAIFLRRDYFEAVGGFDENIFLYFEDDDLSIRLLKAGYGLYHVQDAVVRHVGNASSAPSPGLTRFKNFHLMKSNLYVARKHGAPVAIVPLLVKMSLRWLRAVIMFDHERRAKFGGRMAALREGMVGADVKQASGAREQTATMSE